MPRSASRLVLFFVSSICALLPAAIAHAQFAAGTWVKRDPPPMLMVVEPAGSGFKVSYKAIGPDGKPSDQFGMGFVTQLDGSEAPLIVNGQPSGQTLAIRRVDARHATSIAKMNGRVTGTSKAELSADGRRLTVENVMTGDGKEMPKGTFVEVWERQR